MYEEFFGFSGRPFAPVPNSKTYFPAAGIENARLTCQRVIERAEGPALVIGPPGTGKTLLCQLLAEEFSDPLAVAMLSSGRLKSCQALLQAVHYELNLPYRGMDEGELRLSLMDFLNPSPDGPAGLLLIVDEAHTLPSRLLDEIRLVTNLVRDGLPRVRVVLAGGPSLEERFASPKLSSFAQRVACRCYLDNFDRTETTAYVRAQIKAAGVEPSKIIDDDALRSMFRATDGIPRLINQVCDHALVLAALGGHKRLSSEAIDEAWADLQQLPVPWCEGHSHEPAESQIVEFGNLSDDIESIPFRANEPERPKKMAELHLASPDEQIDAISEQLTEMEEEATVEAATEVDLDFPEFGDPFSEEFAEEEVVLDRYTTGVEIFADVPRVSSWEGRQIGSLLPATELPDPWMKNEASAATDISFPMTASASQPSESLVQPEQSFAAAEDPILPEVPEPELLQLEESRKVEPEVTESPAAEVCQPEPEIESEEVVETSEPVRQTVDRAAKFVAERPAIIVEEDAPLHAIQARPRRNEFRQLFSKMRRG